MMSRSGTVVMPGNTLAPPLCDIALSLSRQPRFAGHSIDPWSVAEHSMVVALIVRGYQVRDAGMAVIGTLPELYALLHDAHESVTGDVPSTWKTPDLKILQDQLDVRIYATLGIDPPSEASRDEIKRADRAALLAEAKQLAAAGVYEAIRAGKGVDDIPQPEASPDALLAVDAIKLHAFTAETAAAYYYGWVRRLLDKWRTA